MIALTQRQADTYDILEREVKRLEGNYGRVSTSRQVRVYQHGVELHRMCKTLEEQLTKEDTRLKAEGSTPELDERWIRNLRRLEMMRALLDRTKEALLG